MNPELKGQYINVRIYAYLIMCFSAVKNSALHSGSATNLLLAIVVFQLFFIFGFATNGAAGQSELTKLKSLSIEELMYVEVTSVSKKEEALFDTAAAVYVITNEDIRRSGVTSIPEALRMAPGVHVAQVDGNKWAVSIRGFSNRFSNKLLVLMDGREVYSPFFAGVLWEVQDTLLEDVERIEVIRGPGATLWGSNAVSGVINIITKNSKDTVGGYVEAGGGTEERGFAGARWGGKIADDTTFRVWGKFHNRDDLVNDNGDRANDGWQFGRGGFRLDIDKKSDSITIQGDIYTGRFDETTVEPSATAPFIALSPFTRDFSGGYILGRWKHDMASKGEFTLQTYYNLTNIDDSLLKEIRHTFDIETQHRIKLFDRHDLIWGLNFRLTTDDITQNLGTVNDRKRTDHIIGGYIQNEITVAKDRLYFIVGSKFEHNSFSGFEIQPTAKALFKPSHNQSFWASISRAVRIPSRGEETASLNLDIEQIGMQNILVRLVPNDDLDPEELLAFEVGYRINPKPWITIDVTAFLNFYDDLTTLEPQPLIPETLDGIPILVAPFSWGNGVSGEVLGFELSSFIQPLDYWKIAINYSYLKMSLHKDSSSKDTGAERFEGISPTHQASIRSYLDLPHNLKFDSALYYVGELEKIDISDYLRLDLRLAWNPIKNVELSVVGQNLFEKRHKEFTQPGLFLPSQVQRSVYGKASWSF